MRAVIKICTVAGIVLATAALAPAAAAAPGAVASAAVVPAAVVPAPGGCAQDADGYGGEAPCELEVTTLHPVCDGDVPRLRYDVTGAGRTDVEITFVNPEGAHVVHSGQPLSGSVLWPGAVVDEAGAPVDWPGWRRDAGTWVVGDEYDWVRPSVQVMFRLGDAPAASAVVAYPPSAPDCLTEPERSDVLVAGDEPAAPAAPVERAEVLSETGSTVGPIALISAGLVLAGIGGVMAARHRRG